MAFKEKECAKYLDQMDWCLVGNWFGIDSIHFNLERARKEMRKVWRLKGNLGLASLGKKKLLLEFDSKGEVLRVLQKGERKFFFKIDLRLWKLDEGCSPNSKTLQEAWVRLFRLPVFLWEENNLKRLGDAYGGFIAADEGTRVYFTALMGPPSCSCGWKNFPHELFIKLEEKSWKIQL